MRRHIESARKGILIDRAASPLKPGQQGRASRLEYFELDGSAGLSLHDHRSLADLATANQVTDPNSDQIATSQFAVDRKVKQCPVSQPLFLIEPEADGPDLLLLQRSFASDGLAGVPGRAMLPCWIKCGMSHDRSPYGRNWPLKERI
jgi:hypothetical protein